MVVVLYEGQWQPQTELLYCRTARPLEGSLLQACAGLLLRPAGGIRTLAGSWKIILKRVLNFGDDAFKFWGRWVWKFGTIVFNFHDGFEFGDDGLEISGRWVWILSWIFGTMVLNWFKGRLMWSNFWSVIFGTMALQFRDDGLEFGDDGLEIFRRIWRLGYSFSLRKRLSQKCHGKFPYFFLDFGFRPSLSTVAGNPDKTQSKSTQIQIGLCRTLLPIYEGSSDGSVNVKVKKHAVGLNGGAPPEVQAKAWEYKPSNYSESCKPLFNKWRGAP